MRKRVLACALALVLMAGLWAGAIAEGTQPDHTVILDPNGGAFADGSTEPVTLTVADGEKIDFASWMPTWEGNTLYGWYMSDGKPFPGARKVTQDLTLKAKWNVEEEEVVYDLVLTIDDQPVVMEYEANVYQFTYVSQIYGGYAQRAGKYTLYENELRDAIAQDDGSEGRLLAVATSNYVDATGTIYGEFYNDGEFELFYDYTNNGERTKYCMNVGYWTLKDYTPPMPAQEIVPVENNFGFASAHSDWPQIGAAAEADSGEGEAAAGEQAEAGEEAATEEEAPWVAWPGETIFTADATESETMKLHFAANGIMGIYFSTVDMVIDNAYTWAFDEEGSLSIKYRGGEEPVSSVTDGVCELQDNYGNAYTFSVDELKAAIPEKAERFTCNASNSDTMTCTFFDDQSFEIHFDLAGFGMEGYSVVSVGSWATDDAGTLQLALSGQAVEITDGTFTIDGNTYVLPETLPE